MIKKDYASVAVLEMLREDMKFDSKELNTYCAVLMEAQAFTMKMDDLLTLIDKYPPREKEIQLDLPFPAIYVEYTECQIHAAMDDVDRCGFFMVANPSGGAAVYMTIHYINGTQLCPAAATVHCTKPVIMTSAQVPDDKVSFVEEQCKAMIAFTGILMDSIVNGGIREYTPSALRRKLHSKRNKKHKILEYKVLKLDLTKIPTALESGGGTHASPRLHLRRGHWRHYKNGEKKWIKPMWVGDKDLGVIHKDYEVLP